MKKKLDSLTQDQINKFPEYVEKWVNIGLSTEPCNHPLAEAALRAAYRVVNIPPPELIIWLNNPRDLIIAESIILSFLSLI